MQMTSVPVLPVPLANALCSTSVKHMVISMSTVCCPACTLLSTTLLLALASLCTQPSFPGLLSLACVPPLFYYLSLGRWLLSYAFLLGALAPFIPTSYQGAGPLSTISY